MIHTFGDTKVNLQIVYWEKENQLVKSQDPDTIISVTKVGTNIYNLLPYDIQLINSFRQNTTVKLVEELSLAPSIIDVFMAGQPDVSKYPPTKNYADFQRYMKNLRQYRWDVIRKLQITEDQKMELFQGKNDSLEDGELFQLARSMKSEYMNIEYGNLELTREDEFISQYQPETILIPSIRSTMALTKLEESFVALCKPHDTCIQKKNAPFWKDGMDFMTMNECVDYKLVEINAKKNWKKERQMMKDLNIHLPVSTSFYEWRWQRENAAFNNNKQNYQRCLAQMKLLKVNCDIKDLSLADKIEKEEDKLIHEMEMKLNQFWNLQKEKCTVADGSIFDTSMVNPRCLPLINGILQKPNRMPLIDIQEEDTEDASQCSDWSGEWSVTSSWENGTE